MAFATWTEACAGLNRRHDFAVIDAFFGIEIVLKALVFDGQWDLIFSEPGHANLQS